MGIRITASQLTPTILRKLSEVRQGALRAITNAAEVGKALAIHATSTKGKVDIGQLKNAWDAKKFADHAEIRNDCPYAAAIEVGSRPHVVPLGVLKEWARRKRGDLGLESESDINRFAFLVQRKIARVGTKPSFIMKDILPDIKEEVQNQVERELQEIARRG